MKFYAIATFVMAAALVVGCKDEPKPAPAPGGGGEQPKSVTDQAKDAAKDVTKGATDAAAAAKDAVVKQAQDLYGKIETAIKAKNFTEADTLFKTLEGLKAQLPAEWAAKIDSLKSMLDTAKKAGSMLPGGATTPGTTTPGGVTPPGGVTVPGNK